MEADRLLQDGEWMSVEEYFDVKAPADAKRKYKTLAAKRSWIVKDWG